MTDEYPNHYQAQVFQKSVFLSLNTFLLSAEIVSLNYGVGFFMNDNILKWQKTCLNIPIAMYIHKKNHLLLISKNVHGVPWSRVQYMVQLATELMLTFPCHIL